jgi:hypothetical protein
MPIDRLYIIRAFNNKPLSLLLFFKTADINIIVVKKEENKSNINNRNKDKNVLLYL